jgi:hypothetical protein
MCVLEDVFMHHLLACAFVQKEQFCSLLLDGYIDVDYIYECLPLMSRRRV